jgi:lipopolysaccharide/colanic/teichoic acid biosynthesis glycosyltransferase
MTAVAKVYCHMIFHSFEGTTASLEVTRAVQMTPDCGFAQSGKPVATDLYRNGGKRIFDLVICLILLPFAVPLIGLLAAMIGLTGSKPFYMQNRIGKHGRVFKMWKLRSMIRDSDRVLASHLASDPVARMEWNCAQKLRRDPRITVFGSLLRRSSMDELPQILNVLRGDMSLIGPRPMMISQEPLYPGRDYYDLLPGISGNWQVSARNDAHFADRAIFDTHYHAALSLREDLRILVKTVGVVLRANGH